MRRGARLRVATKYVNVASRHFARKGVHIDLIKLYGSMELAPLVGLADAIVDVAERETAYKKINQQIAEEYIPGIPISHSPPALVVSGNVQGLVPSPLTAETFDTVTVTK